jgi:hypothetical protein
MGANIPKEIMKARTRLPLLRQPKFFVFTGLGELALAGQ